MPQIIFCCGSWTMQETALMGMLSIARDCMLKCVCWTQQALSVNLRFEQCKKLSMCMLHRARHCMLSVQNAECNNCLLTHDSGPSPMQTAGTHFVSLSVIIDQLVASLKCWELQSCHNMVFASACNWHNSYQTTSWVHTSEQQNVQTQMKLSSQS